MTMFGQALLICVMLSVGLLCQFVLFKTDTNTYLDALRTWPWMWVAYFAVGHLVAERVVRLLGGPRA